jgi:hypothetical protein
MPVYVQAGSDLFEEIYAGGIFTCSAPFDIKDLENERVKYFPDQASATAVPTFDLEELKKFPEETIDKICGIRKAEITALKESVKA